MSSSSDNCNETSQETATADSNNAVIEQQPVVAPTVTFEAAISLPPVEPDAAIISGDSSPSVVDVPQNSSTANDDVAPVDNKTYEASVTAGKSETPAVADEDSKNSSDEDGAKETTPSQLEKLEDLVITDDVELSPPPPLQPTAAAVVVENKCEPPPVADNAKKEQGSNSNKLRLIYFNARGRAESIRLVLALAKADWEDVRISLDDWSNVKPNMPLGQLPVLEWVDDEGNTRQLTQMAAILRATASKFGLAGKSPCEAALADEAFEIIREMGEMTSHAVFEEDEALKEKLLEKLKTIILPRNFGYLEKQLQANGGKFIAGGEGFTFADLAIAAYVTTVRRRSLLDGELANLAFPGLKALVESIEEQPEIKAWLEQRPNTEF